MIMGVNSQYKQCHKACMQVNMQVKPRYRQTRYMNKWVFVFINFLFSLFIYLN